MTKKISIIVPIYNVELYLQECIKSIINQTYKNIEIILVDDGSKDNSSKIIDEYSKLDVRIKAIHQKNGGVSEARNTGINVATGEYIQFVDGDDTIESNMCEELINAIEKTNSDFAICNYNFITKGKKTGMQNNIKKQQVKIIGIKDAFAILDSIQFNYLASSCNKLFKKNILQENRFNKNIAIGEDFLFSTKYLLKCKKIVFINKNLYNYHIRNNSTIHTINNNIITAIDSHEEIINLTKDKISQKSLNEIYKDEFDWCNKIINNIKFKDSNEKNKYKEKEKELYNIVIHAKTISNKRKLKIFIKHYFYIIYKISKIIKSSLNIIEI